MNMRMKRKATLIEIVMLAVVVAAAAVSAIRPHSFAVWMTKMFWVAVGLWAAVAYAFVADPVILFVKRLKSRDV